MNSKKCLRAVPFYIIQGRISYGAGIGVLMKNWENNYGGIGGYRPNFKHDYEEKNSENVWGIGGSTCFFQKIGDRGVSWACNPSPIGYKMEQP